MWFLVGIITGKEILVYIWYIDLNKYILTWVVIREIISLTKIWKLRLDLNNGIIFSLRGWKTNFFAGWIFEFFSLIII